MASIYSRKTDLAYLIFFAVNIPAMLAVDLVPLYPSSLTPSALLSLRAFYIATYKDRFFIAPPLWFEWYNYLELFVHIPVSAWALGALARGDRKVPLVLLPFATMVAVTTLTCVAEALSWDEPNEVKLKLMSLYLPYLGISVYMGIDMLKRLNAQLPPTSTSKPKIA